MNRTQNLSKTTFIIFSGIGLVFVSIVYPKLPSEMRNGFLICFLVSFPLALFIIDKLIGKHIAKEKSTDNIHSKKEPLKTSKSYQDLLTKYTQCSQQIKKCQYWSLGCLFIGWIIIWINKSLEAPLYDPQFFSIAVFAFALLVAMKDLEKESVLDHQIVNCIIEGSKIEQECKLKESLLTNSKSTFQGLGIYSFAFVRISPRLMIIFSALNTGTATLLARHELGLFQPVLFGIVLGIFAVFFGNLACTPYRKLNQKIATQS
ncbi:MAG: hypothetical protein K1000chlam3_00012 [Chlamydiae bacterium]|nr:hypothetical protein [Chlamydiota bacterium]